jgi:SAM-dependent methyltransferase
MTLRETVEHHYGRGDIGASILTALAAAGKDLDRLTPADLAPIDEFHTRGREATRELAERAGVRPGTRVLDAGSGVGGPSRYLAAEFGCHVVGVDLSAEFCEVAAMLADRVGLAHLVEYRQGDIAALPLDDGEFDIVWTQHAAMNVPEKAAMYAEFSRVIRPGGTLALYDVIAGPAGEAIFPQPWAREPAYSFLPSLEELRGHLDDAGFAVDACQNRSAAGLAFFTKLIERVAAQGPPPLGLHVLLGPDFFEMATNYRRSLAEDRLRVVELVARASAPGGRPAEMTR